MSNLPFPRLSPQVLSDDGDALTFCSTCAFSHACLSRGMDKSALRELHVLVEHVGPFHAGDHIFREGEPFEAIAAVRAGSVKTRVIDRDGHEHVLGFHFPGEVIGLNPVLNFIDPVRFRGGQVQPLALGGRAKGNRRGRVVGGVIQCAELDDVVRSGGGLFAA